METNKIIGHQIKDITIEWTYITIDYFEAPFTIKNNGYSIKIDEGKIKAKIDPGLYEKDNKIIESIQNRLNNIFLSVLVISHKPYSLSKSKVAISKMEGGNLISLKANICGHVKVSDHVNIIIKDKTGNIVLDSRQERIEKEQEFVKLALKYIEVDPIVKVLFQSYQASVKDPDNELIHLYEIRETIKKSLGNDEKQAIKMLNISTNKWKRLGILANNEPLKQGRHRGKNPGELREATSSELAEVRTIAREMIYSYLLTLENKKEYKII